MSSTNQPFLNIENVDLISTLSEDEAVAAAAAAAVSVTPGSGASIGSMNGTQLVTQVEVSKQFQI